MTLLQDLLEWALSVSFVVLETLFTRNWFQDEEGAYYSAGGGGNGGSSDSRHRRGKQEDDKIEEAFQTFGLSKKEACNDPAAVRDQAKKAWRKLSLLHHPDRNSNSQDSTQMTQKINHCYEVVCQELDRLEGNHGEKESSFVDEEDRPEDHDFQQPQNGSNGGRSSNKRGKNKKKRGSPPSASDDGDDDEVEMEEMEKKIKKQMQQVKREANRIHEKVRASTHTTTARNRGRRKKRKGKSQQNQASQQDNPSVQVLISERRRDLAHQAWMEATEEAATSAPERKEAPVAEPEKDDLPCSGSSSMDDIDDDDSCAPTPTVSPPPSFEEGSEEEPRTKKPEKPTHLLMESCPDSIAVAIRLGNVEAAASLIRSRTLSVLQNNARRRHVDQIDCEDACLEVLLGALDADANTPLHYAAYFESSEAVSLIMMMAGDNYPAVVLKANDRGQIPVDFCKVCVDEKFAERVEMLTISARQALREKQIGVQLAQAGKRLLAMVYQINLLVTMQTLLSFGVGRYVFGRGVFLSLCGILFPSNLLRAATDSKVPNEAYLFSLNVVWEVVLMLFGLLPSWITAPSWLLLLGMTLGGMVLLAKAASFVRSIASMVLASILLLFNLTSVPLDGLTRLLGLKKIVQRLARRNEVLEGIMFLLIYSLFALLVQWLWQWFLSVAAPKDIQGSTDFGDSMMPLDGHHSSMKTNADVLRPLEKATLAFAKFEQEYEEEEDDEL